MNELTPRKAVSSLTGHLVRRGLPLLVLGGVLVVAYYYLQHGEHNPAHQAGTAPPPAPLPVTVMTTREETVPILARFLGQTEASQVVEIRARVAGHIVDRTFQEGELVQQGQKLFQIDSRPIEVELLQARARLASSEAVLSQATLNLKRNQQLARDQATSQASLEGTQADHQVALANVELQKALIAAAELELTYTSIEAPVTGRIGQVLKDVGNYIGAGGSDPLVTIQKIDPMYVRFPVTEQEMLRFRRQIAEGDIVTPATEDLELEITLADGSLYAHKGKINFQDVKIDQLTGTMVVRGSVPNSDGSLVPGQFIHTTVLGPQRVNVIRVPQSAVLQSPVGASVYVVNGENTVEARPVTLGEWSGKDQWIIERGLKVGEQIILDRLMMLRPGAPVIPTPR
ncbi:efflux RND transporter periplasmic adaptor subunit [Planctomicrobium sp. SH527]|uniref:efflux RND transporter periplasmic adaptor subunit n=1 Tax=Planctomicrobium sp. SH527 TaxID=3448123 RepID=UPI003F5AFE06